MFVVLPLVFPPLGKLHMVGTLLSSFLLHPAGVEPLPDVDIRDRQNVLAWNGNSSVWINGEVELCAPPSQMPIIMLRESSGETYISNRKGTGVGKSLVFPQKFKLKRRPITVMQLISHEKLQIQFLQVHSDSHFLPIKFPGPLNSCDRKTNFYLRIRAAGVICGIVSVHSLRHALTALVDAAWCTCHMTLSSRMDFETLVTVMMNASYKRRLIPFNLRQLWLSAIQKELTWDVLVSQIWAEFVSSREFDRLISIKSKPVTLSELKALLLQSSKYLMDNDDYYRLFTSWRSSPNQGSNVICSFCHRQGHAYDRCRRRISNSRNLPRLTMLNITQNVINNLPVITAAVNKFTAQALIDTGSSYSLLDTQFANKLASKSILTSDSPIYVSGIGGFRYELRHSLKVKITIRSLSWYHQFYILPLPLPVCLGRDFIVKTKLIVGPDYFSFHALPDYRWPYENPGSEEDAGLDGNLSVDPDRIRPVIDFPVPCTLKQVSRFLGMTGFYSKFIPGYADIAYPLN
ncbi:hypothetical protein J437_LFUL010122 [Ladona fulva]|uniref:Peptidase A2 domain-containing protein n=1 Tax=Ladona fulva TaxID=123851 RepID=A0A8K0KIZ2_LADFU|nr:hypothetical protein J437_LFUL010122 [Ladona fulva]